MSSNSQSTTTALSFPSPTHHSDLQGSHAPATAADAVLFYSEVNRTQGVSTNGSSSYAYAMYSETSDTTCVVTVSDDSQAQSTSSMAVTPNTGQSTTSPHMPVQEKYAQLAFKEPVTLLPSLGQPVQYSVVHPSTKGPPPPVPPPHSSSQPPRAPEGDKHPLDQSITIDMAIQQLQQLTTYWWAVGEAARIRRATLKEIETHYKGNDTESFAEVMNQIFIPDHTTWTQLAGVCEKAGFADLATALLNSYTTGKLPIQIDEDSNTVQQPPTWPAPPIPPRQGIEDEEDQDLPHTALPSASLTDPVPPTFPPSDSAPPPRPPKVTKPPPRPPKH
jgi:hypothetical protein